MSTWHRRYPSHDIFGAILSNDRDCCLGSKHVCTSSENDDIYLSPIVSFPDAMSLHTFDDCQVPYDGTPPKMGFGDPLPRAMWGNSSRAHIDMNLWLEIKEYEFNRVNYHCEKCLVGGFDDSSLVLHQRWEYKIDGLTPEQLVECHLTNMKGKPAIASFYRFDVLCIPCHGLEHIFQSIARKRLRESLQHLRQHTDTSKSEDDCLLDLLEIRTRYQIAESCSIEDWSVSWPGFYSHPVVAGWIGTSHSRKIGDGEISIGKFGNCCCYSEYNPGD
jgi:hypothetical protein